MVVFVELKVSWVPANAVRRLSVWIQEASEHVNALEVFKDTVNYTINKCGEVLCQLH